MQAIKEQASESRYSYSDLAFSDSDGHKVGTPLSQPGARKQPLRRTHSTRNSVQEIEQFNRSNGFGENKMLPPIQVNNLSNQQLPPKAPNNGYGSAVKAHGAARTESRVPTKAGPQSVYSGYAGSRGSRAPENGAQYDAQSIAKRSNLSKAANQALGRGGVNPFYSRSPAANGAAKSGGKLEGLRNSQQSSASVADLLAGKLDHDEQDEMAIFTLEQQLSDVKGQLDQAKFKYESRQLYELDQKEKNLKDRLAQVHQAQQQNKNYEDLQRKIRE